MMKQKNVVGSNPTFFELDKVESMDIDDLNDFKVAELMYKELEKLVNEMTFRLKIWTVSTFIKQEEN